MLDLSENSSASLSASCFGLGCVDVLVCLWFPVALLRKDHMSLIFVSLESCVHHSYHLSC